jgi:hypothetical protein
MRKILNIFIIICLSLFTLSISGCSTPPTDKKYVKPVPIPDDVAPGEEKKQDYDFDEKDKKLLKYTFIIFLKDIKISYYEDENIEKEKALIFLILILILDKEFVSKSIEKEWKNLIELEENK